MSFSDSHSVVDQTVPAKQPRSAGAPERLGWKWPEAQALPTKLRNCAHVEPPNLLTNSPICAEKTSCPCFVGKSLKFYASANVQGPVHGWHRLIPGTCVQYPGLQGGGALGDASTPGTPAGSIAASAHGGTYSHVAVAGGTWGGERGAAAATAAAAARRRRATPTGGAVTPPRSAPAQGGRGGRHGARAGGWDRLPRDGAPLIAPLDGVRNRRRAAATEAGAQVRSLAGHRGRVEPRKSLRAVAARNSGR